VANRIHMRAHFQANFSVLHFEVVITVFI